MQDSSAAPTSSQKYQLILADIAMAAAIHTCDPEYKAPEGEYAPGRVRDAYLEHTPEGLGRRGVTAMANAGIQSLQQLPGDKLAEMAARFGVPISVEQAQLMAEHYTNKRNAVLKYNR